MTTTTPTQSATPVGLAVWRLAVRPRTLPAALAPVTLGLAFAVRDGGVDLPLALLTIAVALLLQIAANLANDLGDYHRGADVERLGPPRVTQLGLVPPRRMRLAVGIALGCAFFLGLPLILHGGWPIAVAGALSLLAALAYTGGPFPLAYHGLGEVAVIVFFGGVGVLGTVALQLERVPIEAVAPALAVGLLATAILVVNNLRDRETDARAGKRTWAVRLGDHGALREYQVCLVLAYVAVLVAVAFDPGRVTWLLVALTIPRARVVARAVAGARGRALNPLLGATANLALRFALVLAGGIVLERWIP